MLSSYLENNGVAEAVALQQPSMDVEESPTVQVKIQSEERSTTRGDNGGFSHYPTVMVFSDGFQ